VWKSFKDILKCSLNDGSRRDRQQQQQQDDECLLNEIFIESVCVAVRLARTVMNL
jgi:hypothetical protein